MKYDIVQVEWWDAAASGSGWQSIPEAVKIDNNLITTAGVLIGQNEKRLWVACSITHDPNPDVNLIMDIPRVNIRRMKVLTRIEI